MQSEQTRQGSGAILFVSLVAILLIGIGTAAVVPSSATSTTAYAANQSSGTSTTTTSQGLGLELSLQVTPGIGLYGTVFQINASVTNILSTVNNATGLDQYSGIGSNPICKFAPITFEVLSGYYALANYTSGTLVNVHGPQVYMCVIGSDDLSYYAFQPNSDNFTGPSSQGMLGFSRTAYVSVDVSQEYSDGLTSATGLSPGVYTVVAADNWGQLAIVHFTVAQSGQRE